VAKLPSQPYVLMPHTNVDINVTVNLAGKQGTFFKTIFVYSTNNAFRTDLNLKIAMPEDPGMMRGRNAQIAMADHQAVFRGKCADCHVTPTVGLVGEPLFHKACGICHEALPRDSKVTDLHNFTHVDEANYWKFMIMNGKPNSMMPGFSQANGGPLSQEQIDSLTEYCLANFKAPVIKIPVPSIIAPPPPKPL
jgi:mono/diheme cytochrome c family protein